MIEVKMSDGKEVEITDEQVMLYHMSQAVNQWLHKKGNDVSRYCNYIDRVCDINEVLVEALDKTAESIQKAEAEGKWNHE